MLFEGDEEDEPTTAPENKDDGDWPNDYTPPEGRYSSKWPEDWTKEQIAEEAESTVKNYVDDWGWELHKYARLNNPKRVRKVLLYELHLEAFDGYGKCKEVLNWQDESFGQCALWWVAMHGRVGLAKFLINAGADVNLSDKDGWTPLSVAAFYGHAEIIKILLASGADPSKEVEDGDTAYDKAVAWDHPECAALLKGARTPTHPSTRKCTPTHALRSRPSSRALSASRHARPRAAPPTC